MSDFVARHGLWDTSQEQAAAEIAGRIEKLGVVRFAFSDAHGVLRGKTLVAAEAASVLREGVGATSTMLLKDLSGRTAFSVFHPGGGGAGDMVIVPDPTTFRVLPWAPHTGWLLCDLYLPDGEPHPFSTRRLMRDKLGELSERGFTFRAGVEMELHVLRLAAEQPQPDEARPPGPPPAVALVNAGYQYLTELRYDALDPLLEEIRAALQGLGLPLRSMEIEFGPSQIEVTLGPGDGLVPADNVLLLRSAVKQVCARAGYHATFMSRPKLPSVVSSGWHLHHSLVDAASGRNVFAGPDGLSPLARAWLGGLLRHARAAAAFSTPTINGYKRYRPNSMAPDRAVWAHDNRGAMVRAIGGPGDAATRLENRVGEPAANPYLYMAAQIACGLDGVARDIDPGPSADAPYQADAPRLPATLMEAVSELRESACFRDAFGKPFVDYFVHLKSAEIARFLSEVTDWEHREYFGLL